MRTTDVLLAVPYFVLGIAFLTAVGPSLPAMIVLLGVTGWLAIARVVRIGFHRARELEYVEAARALGFTDRRVMFRHVLPNTIPPVIVYAAIGVGGAVLAEAAFSFIGVGVPGEHPSWGVMVNAARGMLSTSPHLVFFPSLAIFVLVLAFVLVGDGLRDALEPDEAAR
jgi:peptide/nickel transport system permease protein